MSEEVVVKTSEAVAAEEMPIETKQDPLGQALFQDLVVHGICGVRMVDGVSQPIPVSEMIGLRREKREIKPGDHVRVYGHGFEGRIFEGLVIDWSESGFPVPQAPPGIICVKNEGGIWSAHPKQCRRLNPKSERAA